ncbi:ABC transporter ATP-binding protein [Enterococcus sp. BWR-S5]|uniref:ABC transporter ATP-binding protein n=1 Tax=Enterococcus sp. BWR-S5 TaxID=2787714 RepID=UPI0019210E7B|nr:ABC transporter ATP-binding protein [Enterococcus sp. BWR-S5]MBL1224605.1 ABC transporter ATP-binding protein [Enterococcus sp. BWR-S5]
MRKKESKNIIRVENVQKTFEVNPELQVQALKDISFSVKKGQFLSIMGPSGSGKSTLLYILGGLDDPTAGKIWIDTKPLSKMSAKDKSLLKRRDIGFIFQFYNLVPNLTVEDNILLPLILDGKNIKDYQEKLDILLKKIGIRDKREAYPNELSGGQQQRVAIARALIIEPKVILADEPIGNLDSKNGQAVMELLKKINQEEETTIVQVTHSEESAEYGSHVLHMKDGVIIEHKKTDRELKKD